MNKVLVVIDMQHDFISGSLGSPQAQAVLPKVQEKVNMYVDKGQKIIFTLDTHADTYLETQEGKFLPVVHCVQGTKGHEVVVTIGGEPVGNRGVLKNTFGSLDLADFIENIQETVMQVDEVELVGVCTDICVVSNALILKAKFPELKVTVDASCCAGTSEETHNAALLTMKSCQVNIENWEM